MVLREQVHQEIIDPTVYNFRTQGYNGNPKIKGVNVESQWTPEMIAEYKKCRDDPVYFIEKYCKIVNVDEGLVGFKLYPYQQNMIEQFVEERFNIVLSSRQSGKSTTVCGFFIHYAIFNENKTAAILANKAATAREILSRIHLMLENLPWWIQPGVEVDNKGNIQFGNGTEIIAAATSSSSIRGFSCNIIMLDEFAFVDNADEFFTSTYPTISSGKTTKVIIVSTPNGIGNKFHEIWEGSVSGNNEFKGIRIDWFDVPGRDEAWRDQQVKNIGIQQFEQEFCNSFKSVTGTLINMDTLMKIKWVDPIYDMNGVKVYDQPNPVHEYMMVVDVGKGLGSDYSTFSIIDMSTMPMKQVATFRDNIISPLLFPNVIQKWAKIYNECFVIVESNDRGAEVLNALYYDMEYDNIFMRGTTKLDDLGLYMDKKVKRIGCGNLKDLMELGRLEIVDQDTFLELLVFVAKGKSFEASDGNNDDMVMGLVSFGFVVGQQNIFEDYQENTSLREMLWKQEAQRIAEEQPIFGCSNLDDIEEDNIGF